MNAYYQHKFVTICHGDCREAGLEHISAVVTDPPYELGFMGKSWDSKGVSFQKEAWEMIRKMCLSGSPLLSFGGTRTFHRIACAIEDGGWEIRDTLMWVYGSGFPKSLDISKAIDYDACREELTEKLGRKPTKDELKAEWGNFRIVTGHKTCGYQVSISKSRKEQGYRPNLTNATEDVDITAPATTAAQLWEGYGTALKPAYEPIILAMNPLDGTFANNALKHGVAGLNIEECRIPLNGDRKTGGFGDAKSGYQKGIGNSGDPDYKCKWKEDTKGRFPANFIHDGSQMVLELFPQSQGAFAPVRRGQNGKSRGIYGDYAEKGDDGITFYGDSGSAARFFYTAKASFEEREKGLKGFLPCVKCGGIDTDTHLDDKGNEVRCRRNDHPTVKVIALLEYLVKLVKMPEYNLILDPFMGSGTTLLACIRLGIPCIGIDNDEHSCEIAARRCSQEVMELNA